jgi:hypothetical protein
MASVPVVLLTIIALGATFLAVVVGIPLLIAALVVIVITKQRSNAAPAVAAAAVARTPRAAVESAE